MAFVQLVPTIRLSLLETIWKRHIERERLTCSLNGTAGASPTTSPVPGAVAAYYTISDRMDELERRVDTLLTLCLCDSLTLSWVDIDYPRWFNSYGLRIRCF